MDGVIINYWALVSRSLGPKFASRPLHCQSINQSIKTVKITATWVRDTQL